MVFLLLVINDYNKRKFLNKKYYFQIYLKSNLQNFIFGEFFCSLKNAILKNQSTFTTYITKFTLLVNYFFLKKRYFTNVEIYQIDPSMKKKGYILYIVINYDEEHKNFL